MHTLRLKLNVDDNTAAVLEKISRRILVTSVVS